MQTEDGFVELVCSAKWTALILQVTFSTESPACHLSAGCQINSLPTCHCLFNKGKNISYFKGWKKGSAMVVIQSCLLLGADCILQLHMLL